MIKNLIKLVRLMIFKNKINLLFLCFLLISCQSNNQSVEENNNPQFKRKIEQGLILFNSTLEQSNTQGEILWRLQSEKITYSPDRKIAQLEKVTANLFDDDVLVLQVSSDQGELRNDGKEIHLQDNIIAVDPRNNAELRAERVGWFPEQHMMIMTGKDIVKANHALLAVIAKKAKYNTKNQILELEKDIIATTNKPPLQLKTQHLFWDIEKNQVVGNQKLDVVRYKDEIVTDRLKTDKIKVNLNQNKATLTGNIEYRSVKPLLQAAASKITWFYVKREIESSHAITLVQPKEGTTMTANQGKFNLQTNQVSLQGGIHGKNSQNQSQLYADTLNWNLNNQQVNAKGNVYYQQLDPDLNVTGKTAKGNLATKNITVGGYPKSQVTTTIFAGE